MTTARVFSLFLLALVTTATAAPEESVDPAKLKDKISIALGEKLYVRFDRKGDVLSNPKTVELTHPDTPTLSLNFLKQGDNLLLATQNPFPKNLKFRALARHKGKKDYFETSIVPVIAKLASIEAWQEPIEELILFDFKLVGDQP